MQTNRFWVKSMILDGEKVNRQWITSLPETPRCQC